MPVKKTGDWATVKQLIASLGGEMKIAREQSLMRWGLKAEAIAKQHISNQDLGWKPLKARYLAGKIRQGYSNNILVRTGTYFRNITSYVVKDSAYAGIKRGLKDAEGNDTVSIAKVHEYGSLSGRIPARPLWKPTFIEVFEWHRKSNQPARIFAQNIKRKFPKVKIN